MTEVEFHFNAPERLGYACRLLRKAVRQVSGVAVTGDEHSLDQLDRLLWTFDPLAFLPHLRLRAGAVVPPRQRHTPLWLVSEAEQALHQPVLLNLGPLPAQGFESFPRLIEVVGLDADERDAARQRWRHYASRGYTIQRREVGSSREPGAASTSLPTPPRQP